MGALDFERTRLWQATLAPQPDDPHEKARTRLREAFGEFRERAAALTQEIARDLPDFTVHDVTHLDALWEMASLIAGDGYPLTPAEAFVLGGAFLIHDAGMGLAAYPEGVAALRRNKVWQDTVAMQLRTELERTPTPEELANPPAEIQKEATRGALRQLHAQHAEGLALLTWKAPDGTGYRLIESPELRDSFGKIIGRIAHSHWWSVNELRSKLKVTLNPPPWCPVEWTVDPLKLACLLRVADASHVDSRRAPGFLRALRKPSQGADEHWAFQQKLARPRVEQGRLVYTASNPFVLSEADAWWLCLDTLQMIDRELRQVDALLADTHKPQLQAHGVAGVDDPTRLAEYVPTEGWMPVDARVRITDVPSLVERLGGEQLYGDDPTVPLRELIQNASDAVRARRVLEDRPKEWGEIVVRIGEDAQGHWLEVEDTGIGMTTEVLTGALLDFGKPFWSSQDARSALPGLMAKGFVPTGRFGIGFFSVFMWGQRVRVTTRWYEEGSRDTRVLEFSSGLRGRPLVRVAEEEEWLREGGTRVRVWMKHAPASQKGVLAPESSRPSNLGTLCGWLAPALDVNLYVEESDSARYQVVRTSDWMTLDGLALIERISGMPASELQSRYPHGAMFASLMRPLTTADGECVGRACLYPPPDLGMFSTGLCVATVGGLRAGGTLQLAGVVMAEPTRASRDAATISVHGRELARWATDQAELVARAELPDYIKHQAAALVLYLGGVAEALPVGRGSEGWMTLADVSRWKDAREIVVCEFQALGFENAVQLEPGVLVVQHFARSSVRLQFRRTVRYQGDSLRSALISSLASAWSASGHEVAESATWEGDRLIGKDSDGPVRRFAFVIRNPNAKK